MNYKHECLSCRNLKYFLATATNWNSRLKLVTQTPFKLNIVNKHIKRTREKDIKWKREEMPEESLSIKYGWIDKER